MKTELAEHNSAWQGRGGLSQLVAELERQKQSRVDFVSDTRNFSIETVAPRQEIRGGIKCVIPGAVRLAPRSQQAGEWLPDGPIIFNDKALTQLAEKTDPSIPKRFFDKMLDDRSTILEALVNGLHHAQPQKRLVRCLDGKVRGWLSDSYRIIDNYDVAFTCLDEAQRKGAQVFEAGLSDTNMRIKFTNQSVWDAVDIKQRSGPQGGWYAGAIGNKELIGKTILGARINGELPGGPGTIHPVVTVMNSETGHGGFRVRLGILMGICFNVATLEDVVTTIHLGSRSEEGIYSQETVAADTKAIMLKARDAVRTAFDPEKFKKMVAKVRKAQEDKVENPTSAVDNIIEANQINEEHKEALLTYFLRDYDPTRFGLAQAVSRLAQDTNDSDDADKLESIAGKMLVAA